MTRLLDRLEPPAPDPIIRLMGAFAADPRADKIDLGVGVYRDASGRTPVMAAVAAAEARLLQEQASKGYLGLAGDPAFLVAMHGLMLGAAVPAERVAAVATPGGSGAVRQLMELVRIAAPAAQIWVSDPSWPNHAAIARALGLAVRSYPWLDPATGRVDVAAMLAALEDARPGDVLVLQASCHNPTGADPADLDWAAIATCAERLGLVPLVDVAYQGFAAGVEADVAGLRALAAALPELLLAASGSKTFGLYRERVGVALALTDSPAAAARATAALAALNRTNYAFPPDHGARVVTTILADPVLRADWQAELDAMRHRIADNRTALATALRDATQSARFDFLTAQRGMFSLTELATDRIDRLRDVHGVYIVGDGRINLAGLTPDTIPPVARAIAAVL